MFAVTYDTPVQPQSAFEWTWEKEQVAPFNELIVSWNGLRPEEGHWDFWISLHQEEWSPWLHYAEWGNESQKTFQDTQGFAVAYQDAAGPKEGVCDGFRVKVTGDAGLSTLHTVFACASYWPDYTARDSKVGPGSVGFSRKCVSSLAPCETQWSLAPDKHLREPPCHFPTFESLTVYRPALPSKLPAVMLPSVPKQSQMVLDHPRHKDLCSPTSTTTAINYLLGIPLVEPIPFAQKSHDDHWDIYGNWILNTAAAYEALQPYFACHVRRLNSFTELHNLLMQGFPVVVSIRGPIIGSASAYASGHLICIIGYTEEGNVHCIDSAFPTTDATQTTYPLDEFLTAWGRRGNIAYVFGKQDTSRVVCQTVQN